jgi:hypothetical protein
MEQGHVIRSGRIDELIESMRGGLPLRIELVDEGAVGALRAALENRDELKNLSVNRLTIDCTFDGDRAALARLHREVVAAHAGVVSFYERRFTIEDVFMAVGSHRVS